MIPEIKKSTVENLEREIVHSGGVLNYTLDKVDYLLKNNRELMEVVSSLSQSISDKHDRLQAIAICVAVVNVINAQMEIDWLRSN